ncbi:MAG: hypothetical protein NC040_06215 [Muribaculaceae bacterium]|nr:hypothetical protein [Alistipes senegalensis]MCM1473632.1 hypothetical protein [Muribaculaceae bacterium]
MAGRPRKNADNPVKPAAKRGRKPKAAAEALVVEEIITETPVVEEVIAEVPADKAEEAKTENTSEETVETVAEEVPAEEVKPAEEVPKPKRKYTKRAKKVEEPVVVEEPKPKRKYTKREKPVEAPAEIPAEDTSAPKLAAYIQGAGAERSFEELSEIAVKMSGVKSPKSISLYIKPYEHDGIAKVYYVVDNKAGHFNLFN